ncbi:hypothetical protein [Reichenbachiella ulvae]|uniref:Uncharacterized protein n=1 Tax=Reichenbachiella ulvae TaxID=2980104 RepID=A0ABT3CW13_9BACT|nr:hypothetical protein [Reichenbachiella ulvae]MCV9387891.1 hypothetical protein [Reichenbachiella ulvae]
MRYELEVLNTLVFTDLNPSQFINNQTTIEKLDDLKSIAESETDRIKKAIRKVVFGTKKERQIETYIQQHQQELISLTDQLLKYFRPEEALRIYELSEEPSPTNLYKVVYGSLEELLTYIEKYFSKYFSLKAKIPDCYRIIANRDFQEYLPDIEYSLKRKGVNIRLLQIVLVPFGQFKEIRNREKTSFRKLIYLKEMLKELQELAENEHENEELDGDILSNMMYLNYNSFRFFGYYTRFIKLCYQKEDTLYGQMENLAWFNKCISQTQIKPGVAYKPRQKSLKENLLDWLDEEVLYLEKQQQLSLNLSPNKYEDFPMDFKLHTNLSVAQLAYLIKVFIDSGVFKNRNQREVLRFLARFMRTKRAENVSAESLRTKFYNVEHNTKEGVKDLLINMINHIRKN